MFYSGIDLHRDNCYITTVDETGAIVKQRRVPNSLPLVPDYFTTLDAEHQTAVESTTGWYWLKDLLESAHIPMVLAHADHEPDTCLRANVTSPLCLYQCVSWISDFRNPPSGDRLAVPVKIDSLPPKDAASPSLDEEASALSPARLSPRTL